MKRFQKDWMQRSSGYVARLLLAALFFSACGLTPDAKEAKFLEAGRKYMAKKDYARALIEFQNAARAKKGDAEPYYQLGLAYFGMGDYRMCYPALRRALELNPSHLQAQIRMAEFLGAASTRKYVQEGEAKARKVLTTHPDDADALNALAVAEWKLGQRQNAEFDFTRALSRAPQNLNASLNLARLKVIQKDFFGAEDIIKKAVTASPKSADPVLALGELYKIEGKTDAAEQQYRMALQLNPQYDLALLSLANLYVSTNRLEQAEPIFKQMAAVDDPKYRSIYARYLWQTGKREQAISELERLFKSEPADREVRTRLIEAYFASNRLSDGEKVLTAALTKNNKDVDALLQRSRLYLVAGNYSAAQKDISQVIRFQPDSAQAHYVMARIYRSNAEPLSQRQQLTEALRLNKYLLPARLELAELLLSRNEATTALQILSDTPDSQKSLLEVRVARNWALWTLGNMSELRTGIDEALQLGRTVDVLLQDGLWKLRQGKPEAARAAIEEALKINPNDLRALAALGRSYTDQKQVSVAVEKVKEYATRQPKSAPVQDFLGMILMANGELKEARAAFEKAQAADPNFVRAKLSLAQTDIVDGKFEDAQRRLESVLASGGENLVARLWLAHIYATKGDQKAAVQQYRKVVEADPKNAQALNNLAYLVAEVDNQPSEALQYAQKAKELRPDSAEYSDTLGWVLYRKGLYSLAVKELELANSDKGQAVWKYHLAMAYAKTGDINRGRAIFQAGLKQNPSLAEAKIAQDMLGLRQNQAVSAP